MANNSIYKSFVASPFAATDSDGVVLNLQQTLKDLKADVELISNLAYWELTETNLENFRQHSSISQNAEIGRQIGIVVPNEFKTDRKTGNSRFDKLLQDRVVRELRAWDERVKAVEGETDKHVSQGWKRTANANKPKDLQPKFSLSATDKQYCSLDVNDDAIVLSLVVKGSWVKLLFKFDTKRFYNFKKICLPDVFVKNGKVKFAFAVEYEYIYSPLSSQYIVGVDVGISNYVTVSVVEVSSRKIVYSSTLSQRVHSLYNKVRKANTQVSSLQKQYRKAEAKPHRESNSRRKRELAIIAAGEIAHLAHVFDNAIVAVEDLSWIDNTMSNGRWNRGELLEWLEHFVALNGSRMLKVSAHNTSKACYQCGSKVKFRTWHDVYCPNCQIDLDRDKNAAANIALKLSDKGTHLKCVKTRAKAKKFTHKRIKRSKAGLGQSLKYPGRDRTKNSPTPKQVKLKKKEVTTPLKCSAQTIRSTVVLDVKVESKSLGMTNFGSMKNSKHKTYDCRLL